MAYSIYLVEHDEAFSQVLKYCLEQEGWEVTVFGKHTNSLVHGADCPDLWILDADGEEGFRITRDIKKEPGNRVPIIMTSERERVMDRVLGLELGCDDFIVKPFLPRELILRARRIFEKGQANHSFMRGDLVTLQSYSIDCRRRYLLNSAGDIISLTSKEFDLLILFAKHQGIALSREQILRFVWGENYFGSDRVVDDLIRRLRKKVKKILIETLYGYGYRVLS